MERKKNIIISADDFGLNQKSNRNILDLAQSGKLDRVAVMAFGNFSQEEIDAILKTGVKLDIHLHLERLNPDGFKNLGVYQSLPRRIMNFLKLFVGRGGIGKVKDEWQAELDEFRRVFGRNPDGINSHEHIHFFPPFFRLALEFQKELSLPYFRLGEKGVAGGSVIAIILKALSCHDRKILKNEKLALPTSDYFVSFDWLSDPPVFMEKIPDNTSMEILFHPMRDGEYEFLKKNL